MTVQGQGAGVSIVNGNGIDRVFQVLGGANAVFRKMTIEGGAAQDDGTSGNLPGTTVSRGGGVLVQDGGHVTLSQMPLSGNRAIGGNGRAGTAANGNGTPGEAAEGGGLFLSTGAINLTGSKVSGNAATGGRGGAGFSFDCPTLSCPGHSGPGAGGAGGAGAGGGLYVLSGNETLLKSTVRQQSQRGRGAGDFSIGLLAQLLTLLAETAELRRELACSLAEALRASGRRRYRAIRPRVVQAILSDGRRGQAVAPRREPACSSPAGTSVSRIAHFSPIRAMAERKGGIQLTLRLL